MRIRVITDRGHELSILGALYLAGYAPAYLPVLNSVEITLDVKDDEEYLDVSAIIVKAAKNRPYTINFQNSPDNPIPGVNFLATDNR